MENMMPVRNTLQTLYAFRRVAWRRRACVSVLAYATSAAGVILVFGTMQLVLACVLIVIGIIANLTTVSLRLFPPHTHEISVRVVQPKILVDKRWRTCAEHNPDGKEKVRDLLAALERWPSAFRIENVPATIADFGDWCIELTPLVSNYQGSYTARDKKIHVNLTSVFEATRVRSGNAAISEADITAISEEIERTFVHEYVHRLQFEKMNDERIRTISGESLEDIEIRASACEDLVCGEDPVWRLHMSEQRKEEVERLKLAAPLIVET